LLYLDSLLSPSKTLPSMRKMRSIIFVRKYQQSIGVKLEEYGLSIPRDNRKLELPNYVSDYYYLLTSSIASTDSFLYLAVPGATVFTAADRELLQIVAGVKRKRKSTTSLADEGTVIRRELENEGMYKAFFATDGEAVLTEAQLQALQQCSSEKAVVGLISQYLHSIVLVSGFLTVSTIK
jgi:hypothetical protein